jgi:hypothetical protein
MTKLHAQFGLRTALIAVTLICVYLGYVAHTLSYQGEFVTGTNWHLGWADPQAIARPLRSEIDRLRSHRRIDKSTIELSDRFFAAGYRSMKGAEIIDRFDYRVALSDGTCTDVAFWVYRDAKRITRVTVVVYGRDTYPEVVSGVSARRWQERHALFRRYREIVGRIALEAEYGDRLKDVPNPVRPSTRSAKRG